MPSVWKHSFQPKWRAFPFFVDEKTIEKVSIYKPPSALASESRSDSEPDISENDSSDDDEEEAEEEEAEEEEEDFCRSGRNFQPCRLTERKLAMT